MGAKTAPAHCAAPAAQRAHPSIRRAYRMTSATPSSRWLVGNRPVQLVGALRGGAVAVAFDELHKLFKELYEEADAHYDAVSERMRQIGERVVFSCAELAEQSAVNDENNANTPQEMLRGTIDAFAALSSLQTEIWFESDDQKDIVTNDLMVQLNKAVEFKNWMVSAQLGREVEPVK